MEGQLWKGSDRIQNVLLAQSVIKAQKPYLLFILEYRSVARCGGACGNVWVSVEWVGCGVTAWNNDGREPHTVPAAQRRNRRPGRAAQESVGVSSTARCGLGAGGWQQKIQRAAYLKWLEVPYGVSATRPTEEEGAARLGSVGLQSWGQSPRPWLGPRLLFTGLRLSAPPSCLCRFSLSHFLKLVYSNWLSTTLFSNFIYLWTLNFLFSLICTFVFIISFFS